MEPPVIMPQSRNPW